MSEDIFGKIKTLMLEGQWLAAHRACLEVLRFDPENIEAIRLKNKIEKEVQKINRKAIEDDLKSLDPLWKEEKYEDLLFNLKKLDPYIADYPALKKIMIKAENGYKKQQWTKQQAFYLQELASIQELIAKKEFREAGIRAEKLLILGIHTNEINKLIDKIKTEWINYQIEQNQGLLNSEKFEDILLFYQGLLIIDSKSAKILKLINVIKKQYQQSKIEQKREYIYQGLEKIKTLYQLKKYEKALEGAKEILDIDPSNHEAKIFYLKAKKITDNTIDNDLIAQIKTAQKKLEPEYKANKKDFIKI